MTETSAPLVPVARNLLHRSVVAWRHTAIRVLELLAVLALALWVIHARARDLDARLWIDEGISLGIAQHGLSQIPGLLRLDGAPPLFYLLLHWWIDLFGISPRSGHALTLGFAALAVPATWWATRVPFGAGAATLAAAIVALDPFASTYAIEIRMYSLLLLVGVVATGMLLRAFVVHPGHRGWAAGLAVALAAVMYTHNWGLFFALGAGLVWLGLLAAAPRAGRRPLLVSGVIAFGGALALWAPWVPTVLEQVAHTGAPWSHAPTWYSVHNALSRILGGDVAEAVLLLFTLAGLVAGLRTGGAGTRRALLAVLALAAGTFALAFAWSNVGSPAWALRYLAIVLAPGAVLLGAALSRLGAVAGAVVAVLFLTNWYGVPTHASLQAKSNVDVVAARLGGELPPGSVVFSTQPEQVPLLRLHLGAGLRYVTPLGLSRDPQVVDWRDAMERLDRRAADRRFLVTLHALRPRERLLLVQPRFGDTTAPWTRRIEALARRYRRELRATHSVRVVGHVLPHRGYTRSTVSALLLERTG